MSQSRVQLEPGTVRGMARIMRRWRRRAWVIRRKHSSAGRGMCQAEEAGPAFSNPALGLDPSSLNPWTQLDLCPPCLQPLLPWPSALSQLCACAFPPLSRMPFLFFLGWHHTSEHSWNVLCHPHTHEAPSLTPLSPSSSSARAGLSHLIASFALPLCLDCKPLKTQTMAESPLSRTMPGTWQVLNNCRVLEWTRKRGKGRRRDGRRQGEGRKKECRKWM